MRRTFAILLSNPLSVIGLILVGTVVFSAVFAAECRSGSARSALNSRSRWVSDIPGKRKDCHVTDQGSGCKSHTGRPLRTRGAPRQGDCQSCRLPNPSR